MSYLEGKLIYCTEQKHTHMEWLRFLNQIHREVPKDLDVHLIADNYSTHKHAKVKACLKRHKRFHMQIGLPVALHATNKTVATPGLATARSPTGTATVGRNCSPRRDSGVSCAGWSAAPMLHVYQWRSRARMMQAPHRRLRACERGESRWRRRLSHESATVRRHDHQRRCTSQSRTVDYCLRPHYKPEP